MAAARGRSRVLAAHETAGAVVLYRDGAEAGRVPLALRAGEVNLIRP